MGDVQESLAAYQTRALNFWAGYGMARSLSLPLSSWQVGVLTVLSTLCTLLPISIAGIGTRDVSLVLLFSCLGLGREQALAFSFLTLGLVIVHALIGWLSLVLQPPWGRKPTGPT